MDKITKTLLKFVGLIVSFVAFSWLLPLCDNISKEWFEIWLLATLGSLAFAVIFAAWIGETIANWNKKQ